MARSRLHYLNADFDTSLRARPVAFATGALDRQARELTALALLGAEPGDAVLLRAQVADAFLDYLAECGVSRVRVVTGPEADPRLTLRPFGWNAEAIALNRQVTEPARHPDLDCVRRVNARSFAVALEAELFPASARSRTVDSETGLEQLIGREEPGSEWMLKSEHGNAGLGNRRVVAPTLSDGDRAFARARLEEDDHLIVEPFDRRIADCSTVFEVPFDRRRLAIYPTVLASGGGLVGALFESGASNDPSYVALAAAAARIAGRLENEGYFGPVCTDAYTFQAEGGPELRPLVDLNARRALSDPVRRLWRRLAPASCLAFRFYTRGRLSLPDTLEQTLTALGELSFDPASRRGVMLGTPPRFGPDGRERALRQAVLCFGSDRDDARELERRFAERFGAAR